MASAEVWRLAWAPARTTLPHNRDRALPPARWLRARAPEPHCCWWDAGQEDAHQDQAEAGAEARGGHRRRRLRGQPPVRVPGEQGRPCEQQPEVAAAPRRVRRRDTPIPAPQVICVDNFFTGSKDNIKHLLDKPNFELIRHDVVEPLLLEVDHVYHLACPASPVHYK